MVGLFCFDGPLFKDRDSVYCNVTLTDEMFERYFTVVDKLVVIVRTYSTDKSYIELNMKPLENENIEVFEVPNLNTPTGYIIDKRKFENKVIEKVKEVDLIFARMPSNISNSVLKMACRIKKPYLVEVGGCAWDSYWNHGILGKLISPVMYLQERKYVGKADYAIYVTQKFLQNRYPNHKTTTNCSNVYITTVDDNLKERLNKIKTTDCKHVVIGQAVNSIDVKYKGEHLIIRAMGKLKKTGIYIEYQIVGPGTGEYLKMVAKKYRVLDQLNIVGTLKKEEIFDWYKNLDVYVQPSKQEGLPRSVIEAMSTGCPTLGSNLAGIPELLDYDCLFNPDRNNEIVAAIRNILSIASLKEKAEINFERAKEYDIQNIDKRRQEIFKQYMENK